MLRPQMNRAVRPPSNSVEGGTYPLKKEGALNLVLNNISMPPDLKPMVGAEFEGIFLISFSRGPPDDFSGGYAVVAATGQRIGWGLLSPEEEAAKKSAPKPVLRSSGGGRP